jgi:hypothetical protein
MSIVLCVRPIVGKTQRLMATDLRVPIVMATDRRVMGTNLRVPIVMATGPESPVPSLHDCKWTLVQNPCRAKKERDGTIKDGLV